MRVLVLCLLLVGCDGKYHELDGRIVCSLEGNAYVVKRNVSDTSFIWPQPDSSQLCEGLK